MFKLIFEKIKDSIIELIDKRFEKISTTKSKNLYEEFLINIEKNNDCKIIIDETTDYVKSRKYGIWFTNLKRDEIEELIKGYMANTLRATREQIGHEIGEVENKVNIAISKRLEKLTAKDATTITKQLNDLQLKK